MKKKKIKLFLFCAYNKLFVQQVTLLKLIDNIDTYIQEIVKNIL